MKRFLVIGHVWPEPKTTAAGNRMLQLLKAFTRKNFDIIFASTASKTGYSHNLKKIGIVEENIQLNDSSFDHFIRELQPDLVLFDRFMVEEQFGWRVAKNCPKAVRILNTEDLHSLREHRGMCLKKNMDWTSFHWLEQDKTKREIASIYRSDLSLLVSSFEMELVQKILNIDEELLLHLPFMLPRIGSQQVSKWPKFSDRKAYISYGNGLHDPNLDSFVHLKQVIWPLIRKIQPRAILHIYGAYLPSHIKQLHEPKEGFLVLGWVEDLSKEVQNARVVLAPLRFGAGIKGKLALAMQNGTPTITTSKGAEGMSTSGIWPGAVKNETKDFVEQAVQLYQNEEKWYQAQEEGINIVNTIFNEEHLSKLLFDRVETLAQNLENHRQKNFIGSLLQHQSMAAKKYMGKWIEEKNRNPRK